MKKGIIILFSEDEKIIDKNQFINLFNQTEIKLCFVNNGSKDNTLTILESIKEDLGLSRISVLDVKIDKGINAAIKAGARYLLSSGDLKWIMHLKSNMLPYFGDIENQLSVLKKVEEKFKDNLPKAKNRRRAKNIFSYKEFLTFK
jgi:glycosyltransferase involved in cell wall biosynthesis